SLMLYFNYQPNSDWCSTTGPFMNFDSFSKPVQRFTRFWQRLIEPNAVFDNLDQRQQARLLASLLLGGSIGLLILSPVYVIANHLSPFQDLQFISAIITALILFALCWLTRNGYYSFSSTAIIIFGTSIILLNALLLGGMKGLHALYFLVSLI